MTAAPTIAQKQQALNWNEKPLQKLRLSQFKLRYQYREYHFRPAQLAPSAPESPTVDLTRIHRSSDLLVLAFHISFALSARKTAQVLRQVFGVPLSYRSARTCASPDRRGIQSTMASNRKRVRIHMPSGFHKTFDTTTTTLWSFQRCAIAVLKPIRTVP